MKKLVSLLTAFALTASMAVLPAMAEGETETVTPITPLTVNALPKDTRVTFTAATITEPTVIDTYVAAYVSGTETKTVEGVETEVARELVADSSNKTIGGFKYSTHLK